MTHQSDKHEEWLSALVDGEVHGEAFVQTLDYAASAQGQANWQLYHVIGETLRDGYAHVRHGPQAQDNVLLQRLRAQLAKEPAPVLAVAQVQPMPAAQEAANASIWRWKLTAGFASLAAVAALGWDIYLTLGQAQPAAMLAQAAPAQAPLQSAPAAPLAAVASVPGDERAVMLRDPRLDELMAAHRKYGNTAALQVPADFLRNANFAAPKH